ncbi:MAG: TIGR03067 domain-containing protein [Rhodanobacter sp.]
MLLRTDDSLPSDSRHDLALLQGVWEQVDIEADGVLNPDDEFGEPGALTTIVGNYFSVYTVDDVLLLEGMFTLDATTSPRSITWIDSMGPDRGKLLPASYRLDERTFVFIAAHEGAPRPTVFHTVAGQTMRSFVRKR